MSDVPCAGPRPVCVIGTGLIGGSLLRAARDAGRRVWGVDDAPTATQARTEGFDVSTDVEAALLSAAAEDALVVLAVPLPALRQVLGRVAASAPTCRLTDVTSVKAAAGDAAARHAPHARFVGGHPMAGSADAGWGAGRADMLRGAAWAVAADDGIDVDVWAEVAELAWACGAVVVPAAAAEHDRAIARVSHLPHVFAAVLAAVGAAGGDLALALAASSFADATRVAGSSPELVLAMVDGNCDALLGTLDEALERLVAARATIAGGEQPTGTVLAGHAGRRLWTAANDPAGIRVDRPSGNASLALLRAVGRRGLAVIGWTDASADPAVQPSPRRESVACD